MRRFFVRGAAGLAGDTPLQSESAGLRRMGRFHPLQRPFVSAVTSGPFAISQAGFNAMLTTNKMKPEQSNTYEA